MMSSDPASHEPMDDLDWEILDGVRELFGRADPMPADLPERIRFSLAMRDLEAEVARLIAAEQQPLAGVRGAERSRTITFDSDSLTIMIRIDANRDGTVRIDGWLAPAQRREIEMQAITDTLRNRPASHPCGRARTGRSRTVRRDPRPRPVTRHAQGAPGCQSPSVA
jgi:hypothetical protein